MTNKSVMTFFLSIKYLSVCLSAHANYAPIAENQPPRNNFDTNFLASMHAYMHCLVLYFHDHAE